MPIKRRKSKERKFQISEEAVELFRRGMIGETDVASALHLALGLKPWQASPLDVEEGQASPAGGAPYVASVATALALRGELLVAAGKR